MTTFTYTPGNLVAVSGGRLAVLLDLPLGHELVLGVHGALSGPSPTVDDVLDVLVSLGLRTVTTFAIAEASATGIRVVVRGQARGVAKGAEPTTAAEGLWQNRFLDGAEEVTLTLDGPVGPELPLAGGVVLAGSITVSARAAAGAASPTATRSQTAPTASPADDPDASPPEPQHAVAPEAARAAQPTPASSPAPQPSPVTPPAAEQPDEDEEPAPDFDHLFGATQVPASEPAAAPVAEPEPPAARAAEREASAPTPPPVPAEEPESYRTTANPMTGPVPVVQPPAEPRAGASFIDALPWEIGAPSVGPDAAARAAEAAAEPAPPLPEPTPEPAPEEAPRAASRPPEMTIDRDQLIEHGGAVGPLVVAARCPDGHLSPAYAGNCRVCGKALPAQQPFEAPRPPLGVLRLSNGDTVMLDRGAVLGRNPRLPQGWTGEQPNLVKIHDPERDISSQHLEVRLDYWHVLVKDLGSTNGTEVILPGADPVALRANDAITIEPGTRVVLAGVFDFTFEVTP